MTEGFLEPQGVLEWHPAKKISKSLFLCLDLVLLGPLGIKHSLNSYYSPHFFFCLLTSFTPAFPFFCPPIWNSSSIQRHKTSTTVILAFHITNVDNGNKDLLRHFPPSLNPPANGVSS